jgi:hypothetical protein
LAKQAIAEGIKLVICIDEVHVLLDSRSLHNGYRTFQAMWTMLAALDSYDVTIFATSATVRPRIESVLAHGLGLEKWRSGNQYATTPRCDGNACFVAVK